MKIEVVVSFQVDPGGAERLRAALGDQAAGREFEPGIYEVRFARREAGLPELIEILEQLRLDYSLTEERSFRRRELEGALALHIAPGPEATRKSPRAHVEEEEACPVCGAGTGLPGELVVEGEIPDHPAVTVLPGGRMLVREEVARDLVAAGITGCLLRTVRDAWGRRKDVFELLPVHMLPPLQTPPTRFQFREDFSCPNCREGGRRLVSMLYYDAAEEAFMDVNVSTERFGRSPRIWREMVVSQRMFRILAEHGAEDIQVEPVILV